MLGQEQSYYDVLELAPDATIKDIRESYMRMKAAYCKDSVALYTLMDRTETEELLRQIESAYLILSDQEKRKDYDRNHGFLKEDAAEQAWHPDAPVNVTSNNVVSIDRVPSMEKNSCEERFLEPRNVTDPFKGETEWKGETLRKAREYRQISLEELSDYTRISRSYLLAIEAEDYKKLPASVFLRGFVFQIAKRLRLPYDQVAVAYLTRYRRACPEKG